MSEVKKRSVRLPPGQREIDSILRWGIDHPGITKELPRIERSEWSLKVEGEVERNIELDWDSFLRFPQVEIISDFHCVEGWSILDCRWEGVLFQTIVDMVEPKPVGRYVFFKCADGYSTSLDLGYLMGEGAILAHRLNGEDLSQPLGGPLRLVVPSKYAYKSPMWLTGITFSAVKKLGFWESGAYSDTADPWKNDRYRK